MTEQHWRRDGRPIGIHQEPEMVTNDGEVTGAWFEKHWQEINPDSWTYYELCLMYGDPHAWKPMTPVGILHGKDLVKSWRDQAAILEESATDWDTWMEKVGRHD